MPGPHPEGAALLITASPAPGKYEVHWPATTPFYTLPSEMHLWVQLFAKNLDLQFFLYSFSCISCSDHRLSMCWNLRESEKLCFWQNKWFFRALVCRLAATICCSHTCDSTLIFDLSKIFACRRQIPRPLNSKMKNKGGVAIRSSKWSASNNNFTLAISNAPPPLLSLSLSLSLSFSFSFSSYLCDWK